jgi:hypothetical protein
MKIQLFHQTNDSDLSIGQKVCYQNFEGVFVHIGIITHSYIQDGLKLYSLHSAMGLYAANELKLVS